MVTQCNRFVLILLLSMVLSYAIAISHAELQPWPNLMLLQYYTRALSMVLSYAIAILHAEL